MSHPIAPGCEIRRPRSDEVEAVHALVVASDLFEFGESHGYTLEELQDEWSDLDLDRDAWVAVDSSGTIAGYGNVHDRRHVRMDAEGYVHPDHFGQGIGTTLVRLCEARAREHVPLAPPEARVVVNNWINALNDGACALLDREGYEPARYFWRMEAELEQASPAPEWPEGIDVRTLIPGEDERIFYATMEEAMADHWGHVPLSFESWIKKHMRHNFDPALWFLAKHAGEPAGAAMCSISEGIGWVDNIGVRRPWRRRGLGLALLRHATGELQRRGLQRIALGVDAASPTGATRLYERAGMRVAQQYATYAKELRPGEELTDAEDES